MKLTGQDPYDALAAIFLGNCESPSRSIDAGIGAAGASTGTAAGAAVGATAGSAAGMRSSSLSISDRPRAALLRVTAAVTGHLPVMAGLWATQFADRVGAVDGPTGLIRCERELVHAEILRSGGRHVGLRQDESFEEWLARAARLIRRWIICVSDGGDSGEVLDPGFAERVLLTSADEAAVAAARRVVASISANAEARGANLSLGVVVVGAPPERVSWMADELATAPHGAIDLPLAGPIQRMDRVDSSERYGFEVSAPPSPSALLRILERAAERAVDRLVELEMHERRRPPAMSSRAAASVATEQSLPREPTGSVSHAMESAAEVSVPNGSARGAVVSGAVGGTPAAPAALAPAAPSASPAPSAPSTPSASPMPATPGADHTADLAARLSGVTALGMRCAVASMVELASDNAGRLHLVAPLAEVASLRAARAWAVTNEPLLRRAFPALACATPMAQNIIERVVTTDAVAAESLHGSGIAIDLLVEIRLGSSAVFHHVPLNALARG